MKVQTREERGAEIAAGNREGARLVEQERLERERVKLARESRERPDLQGPPQREFALAPPQLPAGDSRPLMPSPPPERRGMAAVRRAVELGPESAAYRRLVENGAIAALPAEPEPEREPYGHLISYGSLRPEYPPTPKNLLDG